MKKRCTNNLEILPPNNVFKHLNFPKANSVMLLHELSTFIVCVSQKVTDLEESVNKSDQKYLKLLREHVLTQKENEDLKNKLDSKEKVLELHSLIVYIEMRCFPRWLQNLEISRIEKWTIALMFQLTPDLEVLAKRTLKKGYEPKDVAELISGLHGTVSQKYAHPPPSLQKWNSVQWKKIFAELQIESENEQQCIKLILTTVTPKEKKEILATNEQRGCARDYVIEMTYDQKCTAEEELNKAIKEKKIDNWKRFFIVSSFPFKVFVWLEKQEGAVINQIVTELKSAVGVKKVCIHIANE